jgi:hypothetical protein
MIARGNNFKSVPLNIVGSSVFGRYPKISTEKTYNMFISDSFLINYAGYQIAIPQSQLGSEGRGAHTSTKLGRIVTVVDDKVYLINIFFDQDNEMTLDSSVVQIGTLLTNTGVVYIAENNKPQVLISDNTALYLYDPTLTPTFQQVPGLNFIPGFIDFHDTYFLCAASQDQTYAPPANNTWRLSDNNNGLSWPSVAQNVGLLQTKPDNTQAVVRFPSKGNMIAVMGQIVTEFWFDTGAQLFPYQRNNQMSIDYGCLSPATIAYNDEIVVWLAQNEKSGPIIMYSMGGEPEKITTDGIDYLFSQFKNPADSRAFLFRQDGHLIYHINFYTDNVSLFYDFNTKRFFHASDENLNFFIGHSTVFFNNQYYFVSKNNGNLYAFDTIFTTYSGAEIPRIRTCKNIRFPNQQYVIANDIGFTIETGETDYQEQDTGPLFLITEDDKFIITEGNVIFILMENGNFFEAENGDLVLSEQSDPTAFNFLISEQDGIIYTTPRVDLSVSYDGGASFSSDMPYVLNPIGLRKNRLMWWQGGAVNDLVCQFKFWGLGRFVATDGEVNIRQ